MTATSIRGVRQTAAPIVVATALLAAATLGAVLAFGCQKEAPASAELPTAVNAAAVAEQPTAPVDELAKSKLSENNFELEMKTNGAYKAGQPAAVQIVLVAKGPYKVNDKYPYKFKTRPTDGVKYPSPVVKQDKVELEQKRAIMTVEFTPESTGAKQLAGEFAFSVCTDERCLIEKRDLAVEVTVN